MMTDTVHPDLHSLLSRRRSPRAFDPEAEVTQEEIALLLEAARWAPSSWNSQPWRFLVGPRGSETHKRVLALLAPHNQQWAGNAGLLLVAAHLTRSRQGDEMRYGLYDLGQAVAHLSIQATALGLFLHQMAGFNHDGLHAEFALPAEIRPRVVIAVGRLRDPVHLPDDLRRRERAPRRRLPVDSLLLG
jgi:nitroreductase